MPNNETKYFLADIETLIPYARNARTHSEAQIAQIAASIKEFGFLSPIIISEDNTILCGHGRFYGAQKLGLKKVPCVMESHLTENQRRAYILADNKLSLNAGWDNDMLAVELSELQDNDFDLSVIGFDESELVDLFGDEEKDTTDDDFDVDKALEGEAFVQPGDIWLLGKHRLLCGDATKPEDVRKVLDGKKANVCITDPPYNCAIVGGTGMTIQNDKWSDSEKFYTFLLNAFKNIYDNTADGGAFYCFHSDAEKCNFFNATVNAGFHYSTTCIWVKDALVIGRADFQQKHEPCIYAFKDTAKHKFYGDRKQTTVWEFPRPKKSTLHPTMKTIPLIAYPMSLSSQENSIVLDVFGGSGTTLMAAERLNRVCCTIELDPKYASAIVRRFIAAKQRTDEIFVIRNGEKLPCTDVYTPTEDDLAFKEDSVNRE